jgi:ABC-2 type transport system permease protein
VKLRPIAGIALRQFYLLRGSPTRVVPTIAWVAIDIVLWGFITRYLNAVAGSGVNFVPTLLGGVLLWDFLTRIMQGVSIAFMEDIWARNFLNLFSTPLLISEYVTGLVVTSIVTGLLSLVVMLILASAAFGLAFFQLGVLLVPFLLVLFVFGIALGILASAMVLRLGPASEWLVWPLPALLSPFAGVFYPLSTLPHWMRAIGELMPASYVFEGLRAAVAGKPFQLLPLAFGGGLALLYLAIAGWVFGWVFRHVVRTGLLARYSAESVS